MPSRPRLLEAQRLMGCQSLEHVLQNLNKLNRSLEGVIAVSVTAAVVAGGLDTRWGNEC